MGFSCGVFIDLLNEWVVLSLDLELVWRVVFDILCGVVVSFGDKWKKCWLFGSLMRCYMISFLNNVILIGEGGWWGKGEGVVVLFVLFVVILCVCCYGMLDRGLVFMIDGS